jgi:hypothetical protein
LDGPLPKWCPAVALSRQDGRYSAVALLLKAALIQVSDYRLLGASGFSNFLFTNLFSIKFLYFFIINTKLHVSILLVSMTIKGSTHAI